MDPAISSLIDRAGLDKAKVAQIIGRGLEGADDGELFLEYKQSEALVFDNGRLKQATYDTAQGFGLRAVKDEAVGYAHASDLSEAALARAAEAVRAVKGGHSGHYADAPGRTNRKLYGDENPLGAPAFDAKVKLLESIDAYARAKDARVRQVSASLAATWQVVEILRADGSTYRDIRPLVRLNVSTVVGDGDRQERAPTVSAAARAMSVSSRRSLAARGRRSRAPGAGQSASRAGAGRRDGCGDGLGLAGRDAARSGRPRPGRRFQSQENRAFAGLMGQQVAAKGVTVVDDGTMQDRRGSLSIDDEGTPTNRTVLIEDGILVGYMQDRQNARLMNMKPTGNGRRESHAHVPMPRMTNTYMLAGQHDPQEIIASVKNGLYAVSFGGGQVDITSGKYVFQCTEAYKIENGKVTAPVKGAMLIGNGPTDLHRISMIGNDFALDPGIGTCGKNGQGVPVGVGQPSLRMDRITVGGTA